MILTNKHKIDLALAVWLLQDDYDYNNDPDTISATALLQPLKPLIMAAQRAAVGGVSEHTMDVMDTIGSRMGSALHDSLETAWQDASKVKSTMLKLGYPESVIKNIAINPSDDELTMWKLDNPDIIPVYVENRSHRKLGKWTVSGKYDLIINGQVEDYKSGSVYGYIFDSNRENYILQESIYKWLNPTKITQDKGKIHYLFTDWSAAKAKQEKNYPPTRCMTKEYVLMSLEEIERWISEKLQLIEKYIRMDQDDLPSCTPKDLWQKDSKWKYYKNPQNKTRATKNFTNEGEAYTKWQDDGKCGEVVHVPGEVVRCKWCDSMPTCNQAKQLISSGLLIIES